MLQGHEAASKVDTFGAAATEDVSLLSQEESSVHPQLKDTFNTEIRLSSGEVVSISLDSAALKRDVSATFGGYGIELNSDMLKSVVIFDTLSYFIDCVAKPETPTLSSKIYQAITQLKKFDFVNKMYGCATYDKNKPYIFLNTRLMSRNAEKYLSKSKDAYIRRLHSELYRVWRHEKQHLLRLFIENENKVDKRAQIAKIATSTVVPIIAFSSTLYLLPELPPGSPNYQNLELLRYTTALLATLGTQQITSEILYRFSPDELDSNKTVGEQTVADIFKIDFLK